MGSLLGGGKGQQQQQAPPPQTNNNQDLSMLMAAMAAQGGGGGGGTPPAMPVILEPPEIQRTEIIDWREKEQELRDQQREAVNEENRNRAGRRSTIVAGADPNIGRAVTTQVGILGT